MRHLCRDAGKKSLFSGNCQVGCCLLHVLQLGHHTPHKISASSGFNAFLCSTLAFFIVAMASHLQLCSIEGFGKRPYSFLQCDTCAVTQGKKSLFSGNCQVGCCLLHVLQLGHHTPHKISASSGFNAFLCSTLAFFIVAMASHLQLCSIEGFGKRPYSFLQCDTCAVTRVKKAYSVGIVKSAAACCTCFSLVIILHIKYLHPLVSMPFCASPLPSSLLPWRLICNCVRLRVLGNVHTLFCNATPVPWRTGRTKVALVELPAVNMFGFFFCTPFPLRILAWSFVVPRSNFHPPKAFNLIDLKAATPATRNGLGNVIRGWPRWMLCQAVKKHKLCSSWRVKKTYSVGIVKSAAACCTCFSLVIILHIKYLHPLVSMPFCAAPLPSSLLPWRLICNSVRLRVLGNVHTLFCNATPVPWRG